MPPAQGPAAAMPCDRFRHIPPAESKRRASQSEIDIFKVRFKTLLEHPRARKQFGAEKSSSPGRREDRPWRRKGRAVGRAATRTPGSAAATDQVERAVDAA